jgi:hypothetical protein
LVGELEGKRPLERQRRRRVDNITMDTGEVRFGGVDWIGQAQDKDKWGSLVNALMNLWVPYNAANL